MCGIAAFVGNRQWIQRAAPAWPAELRRELGAALDAPDPEVAAAALERALGELAARFDEAMSFGVHAAARDDVALRAELEALALLLARAVARLSDPADALATRADSEALLEAARDQEWQLSYELLGGLARTEALLPEPLRGRPAEGPERARAQLAWALEQVLENLDRLEVRGRDSAGLDAMLELAPGAELERLEKDGTLAALEDRARGASDPASGARLVRRPDGGLVACFAWRVASVVGRLGENTERLRAMIRDDRHLWSIAPALARVNTLAHTRWASNGIINVANCHPVDAALAGEEGAEDSARDLWFVLNGDVDNCGELERELRAAGHALDPRVTTDAKLLPLLYRLDTDAGAAPRERFARLMARCHGSLAVGFQDPARPAQLMLALKGSGQGLSAARTPDGWIVSSEIYGLAARARAATALVGQERGGTLLELDAEAEQPVDARYLADDAPAALSARPIELSSRDVFRGEHRHFLAKELGEAPDSIRKTLRGKYVRGADTASFVERGPHSFEALLRRLRDPDARPVDEVLAIGQGTASIAAMGAAHLIERALAGTGVRVSWAKASEVSGFGVERRLDGMLLVPISQSGTTTDTNRTVDVLSARGAWVHAIVNRRDSPLVRRSDSHTYTSDGRDVEMSVASTKAFYSQIAAAKLLALCLARELGTRTERELARELRELESLPDKVGQVLDDAESVAEVAAEYAPRQANWALVGNGPNKIAAEEVRIKISELCYKSIPCDHTEDKKHIDLSTEPLTLVVAADLPESVVGDTAKEVSIFKAHGGRPIVIAARGEDRFDAYAERVLHVPAIGADLGFVLATVAGHLFGYHAALAIDRGSERFRELRSRLAALIEGRGEPSALLEPWGRLEDDLAAGALNAALKSSTAAALGAYRRRYGEALASGAPGDELLREGVALLTRAVEETARPIDSIRHQAKTVTVGLSRPEEELASPLVAALRAAGFAPDGLAAHDARELRAVSPWITGVAGSLRYEAWWQDVRDGMPLLRATARAGSADRPSRYDAGHPAAGMKRKAIRLGHCVWSAGKGGAESLLLVPFFADDGTRCASLFLLHLEFVERAPAPQKLAVLRRLGARYDELVEALEERDRAGRLEQLIEALSPRDLVLAPVAELAGRA